MRNEIAQALLLNVLETLDAEAIDKSRKYFQTMAKYKYDDYQQFAPGMRFIERFALWLNQIDVSDRKVALDFIKNRLVFLSTNEINILVSSCFQDLIKPIVMDKASKKEGIPEYKVNQITNSISYKTLIRQSLYCGLSDGARTDIFRRSNPGIISHEQIYQTYELSIVRSEKMQEKLIEDITKILETEMPTSDQTKFKLLFLLDDFSASGTSYLKWDDKEQKLKGKINALYSSIFSAQEGNLKDMFDLENLEIHIVLYVCTEQAKSNIENNFEALSKHYKQKKPKLHCQYLLPDGIKLSVPLDNEIIELCLKEKHYDKESWEDIHTGTDIHLGFGQCALPLVLSHNCPNNSVPILWGYEDSKKFQGLFPRIPRHKEL